MLKPPAGGITCVVGRLPIKLLLVCSCVAMFLVPGDAVANAGGGAAPGSRPPPQTHLAARAPPTDASVAVGHVGSVEGLPEGVPTSFDWARHPRARPIDRTGGFRAFTAWGQLYQCAGTPATPDASVYLRDLQAWVLFETRRAGAGSSIRPILLELRSPTTTPGPPCQAVTRPHRPARLLS